MNCVRLAVGCVLVALVVGLAPARAAELLGTSERPTTADAYGDTIVWSPWSRVDGRYHLTAGAGADAHELAVAPSELPFADVNLGPGPAGSLWAVYSRCIVAPDGSERGCDCSSYVFADGSEAPLEAVTEPVADERLPSV